VVACGSTFAWSRSASAFTGGASGVSLGELRHASAGNPRAPIGLRGRGVGLPGNGEGRLTFAPRSRKKRPVWALPLSDLGPAPPRKAPAGVPRVTDLKAGPAVPGLTPFDTDLCLPSHSGIGCRQPGDRWCARASHPRRKPTRRLGRLIPLPASSHRVAPGSILSASPLPRAAALLLLADAFFLPRAAGQRPDLVALPRSGPVAGKFHGARDLASGRPFWARRLTRPHPT